MSGERPYSAGMIRFLLAALVMLVSLPAHAAATSAQPHTTVALIAESLTPAPGRPVTLGLAMTPRPGWHIYWKNPGDAGMETRALWTLPGGVTAGELRYPTPGTLVVAGLMNHVYEQRATLLAELAVPAGIATGTPLPVAVKLDWLVCSDSLCVPEKAELTLDLKAGDGARGPGAAAIDAARAALPRPLGSPAAYSNADGRFRIAVPVAGLASVTSAHLFPLEDGAIDYAAPQALGRNGNALIIETKAGAAGPKPPLHFVLRLDQAGKPQPLGLSVDASPGVVPTAEPLTADTAAGGPGLATAFLLAVLGGLILNVMPCVFPILSLKALSLARGGVSEHEARRDALAYAAGVILTCTALGAAILGLRAAGNAVGWAFQLQDPRVILLLLLLTLAIGFNLAGLFEMRLATGGNSLASKPGAAGAFWTGALAAFVATPCTGPFMGAALGAALALPTIAGLAIFAGLGLGLALPFLAIGMVPALRRRLPKPGAWMDSFRRILSLPMLLTAVALAWVLGRQSGVDGMALGLVAALGTGALLWWLGLRQLRDIARPALIPAIGILLVAGLAASTLHKTPAHAEASGGKLVAQPFSDAKLAALTAAHKPAFVYFTADWCITCKVNEHGAMASPRVAEAFRKAGVSVLVGDWTDGDAAIGRFLDAHGRAGVPLYLYYRADGQVRTLPQLLTPDLLVGLTA